jgi:L-ascorbate metabolism protein UlaG (beta-lactamase superfamily)
MEVRWFGHSFFLVTTEKGKRITFDPFDQSVGYPLPEVEADMVLVSHEHFDHNNVALVRGYQEVIRQPGEYRRGDIRIQVFPTFHDEEEGKKRGRNNVFRVEVDEMVLMHMGDLGAIPRDEELQAWKPVHLLFVPVGGVYTIDARGAQELVGKLSPSITVPMHYKTRFLSFSLNPVEHFLRPFERVKFLKSSTFTVTAKTLPSLPEVWVLEI